MSGYYKITCFCKQCNGNNTETASGNIATEGITVAVHKSLYNEYGDGHEIKIMEQATEKFKIHIEQVKMLLMFIQVILMVVIVILIQLMEDVMQNFKIVIE